MPDRILDFSEEAAHLSVRLANLVVRRSDKPEVTLPLAEIGVVVVSHPQVTLTHAVLAGLAAAGAAFVTCDDKRLPVGLMLPLQGHHTQSERISSQVSAKLPVRKRLWQQIVRAKISAQAAALVLEHGADHGLNAMASRVRSGDPENVEAQAARRYWPLLIADDAFRRDREAEDINGILNYGYAVLRAMTGRAICASGLHPSIGLHHHNRYSQFTLADDLMEPFRVVVDRAALEAEKTWGPRAEVSKEVKAHMIAAVNDRYWLHGEQRSLFEIVARCSSSLAAVFAGDADQLVLPEFPDFFNDAHGDAA